MAFRPVIAVLLPSRGRPGMLAAAVGSLLGQAARPDRVRVFAGVDTDDLETIHRARELGARTMIFKHLGWENLHVYYGGLARLAVLQPGSADWLLVWNDDATMLTPGWDMVLDAQAPGIAVADLQSRHSPICCFPAVRREAFDAIGQFCSDNPHVDSFWEVVGRESGTIAAVPIWVRHDQQPHAHQGNEHGFHEPGHRAGLSRYADVIRSRIGAPA